MMLLAEKLPKIHLKMTSMAVGLSKLAAIALATFSQVRLLYINRQSVSIYILCCIYVCIIAYQYLLQ